MNERGDVRSPLDDELDALAHEQRRGLLLALHEDPAREVAIERGDGQADTRSREALIAMHHTHLPKLEERGVVTWDRGSGRVTRGPRFEEIEPLLAVITEHRDDLSDGRLEGVSVLSTDADD